MKRAEDIRVGDLLRFMGHFHRVAVLEPYQHPDPAIRGWIAHCEADWVIALLIGETYEVA